MQALLERIGITREAVSGQLAALLAHGREMLASEALRPAATTDRWQTRLSDLDFAAAADAAMAGVSVIEAANPEEEALSIAVCLRETIETQDKTVALVTPDLYVGTPRGGRARTLAGRSRRSGQRCPRRHTCRNLCATGGGSCSGRTRTGAADCAVETFPVAALRGGTSACSRHCRTGACRVARARARAGVQRACARVDHVQGNAAQPAPQRPAQVRRRRPRSRRTTGPGSSRGDCPLGKVGRLAAKPVRVGSGSCQHTRGTRR